MKAEGGLNEQVQWTLWNALRDVACDINPNSSNSVRSEIVSQATHPAAGVPMTTRRDAHLLSVRVSEREVHTHTRCYGNRVALMLTAVSMLFRQKPHCLYDPLYHRSHFYVTFCHHWNTHSCYKYRETTSFAITEILIRVTSIEKPPVLPSPKYSIIPVTSIERPPGLLPKKRVTSANSLNTIGGSINKINKSYLSCWSAFQTNAVELKLKQS